MVFVAGVPFPLPPPSFPFPTSRTTDSDTDGDSDTDEDSTVVSHFRQWIVTLMVIRDVRAKTF